MGGWVGGWVFVCVCVCRCLYVHTCTAPTSPFVCSPRSSAVCPPSPLLPNNGDAQASRLRGEGKGGGTVGLGSLAEREAARVSRRAVEAGHGGGVGGGRSGREGDGILVFDRDEGEDRPPKPKLEPLLESPSASISALAAAADKPDKVPPPPPLPAAAAASQKEGSEDASNPADASKERERGRGGEGMD